MNRCHCYLCENITGKEFHIWILEKFFVLPQYVDILFSVHYIVVANQRVFVHCGTVLSSLPFTLGQMYLI